MEEGKSAFFASHASEMAETKRSFLAFDLFPNGNCGDPSMAVIPPMRIAFAGLLPHFRRTLASAVPGRFVAWRVGSIFISDLVDRPFSRTRRGMEDALRNLLDDSFRSDVWIRGRLPLARTSR